jgi:hypothetical protein
MSQGAADNHPYTTVSPTSYDFMRLKNSFLKPRTAALIFDGFINSIIRSVKFDEQKFPNSRILDNSAAGFKRWQFDIHVPAKLSESMFYKLFLYSFDSINMSDIKKLPLDTVGVLKFRADIGDIRNLQCIRISEFL